jgi:hypothetical protein
MSSPVGGSVRRRSWSRLRRRGKGYDPVTQAYLARKQAERKPNKGALRCLKRHVARRFHRLLSPSAQARPKPHDTTGTDTTTAPMRMVCPT